MTTIDRNLDRALCVNIMQSNITIFSLTVLYTLAVFLGSSRDLIYHTVGCWPTYAIWVLRLPWGIAFISAVLLSVALALRLGWISSDNSLLRNILSTLGGFSISLFAWFLLSVVFSFSIRLFGVPMYLGFVVC